MKNLSILLLAISLIGCTDKGPMQSVGKKIDDAVKDIGATGETVGGQIDDALDDVRNEIEDAVE